jgi:23S rRNA pseudouridine2605 synthase
VNQPPQTGNAGERIAKRMARAGLCSRREAERWIAAGRVKIDGKVVSTPATLVTSETAITVDGQKVAAAEKSRMWRYHKPKGLICTANDPEGRKTIFDALPDSLPRVLTIGRLDLNSEGLLLLTNDGELARRLELPATGWSRRYRVRVYGAVDTKRLAGLSRGVTIDGMRYGPIEAKLDSSQGANSWLTMTLKEGKNREIRRVLETLDLTVNRLIRISFGPFQSGLLKLGEVEEIPGKVIRDQIGDADRRR